MPGQSFLNGYTDDGPQRLHERSASCPLLFLDKHGVAKGTNRKKYISSEVAHPSALLPEPVHSIKIYRPDAITEGCSDELETDMLWYKHKDGAIGRVDRKRHIVPQYHKYIDDRDEAKLFINKFNGAVGKASGLKRIPSPETQEVKVSVKAALRHTPRRNFAVGSSHEDVLLPDQLEQYMQGHRTSYDEAHFPRHRKRHGENPIHRFNASARVGRRHVEQQCHPEAVRGLKRFDNEQLQSPTSPDAKFGKQFGFVPEFDPEELACPPAPELKSPWAEWDTVGYPNRPKKAVEKSPTAKTFVSEEWSERVALANNQKIPLKDYWQMQRQAAGNVPNDNFHFSKNSKRHFQQEYH